MTLGAFVAGYLGFFIVPFVVIPILSVYGWASLQTWQHLLIWLVCVYPASYFAYDFTFVSFTEPTRSSQ